MAFESVAAIYDATFGRSPVGRLFRFRLAERITGTAKPLSRILDIGCGTGEDAIWLAGQGHAVLGIDASALMIEQATAKAARIGSTATFECRSLQSLQASETRFDVVVSNFGAMNCVPLSTWTELVPRLLAPGGRGFVVLMGDRPLPETLRPSPPVTPRTVTASVGVGTGLVTTYYEPVSAVVASLSARVRLERVEAMGCLVPGPTYSRFPGRHPLGTCLLAMGESIVRRAAFFRDRGDHTLFEFTPR